MWFEREGECLEVVINNIDEVIVAIWNEREGHFPIDGLRFFGKLDGFRFNADRGGVLHFEQVDDLSFPERTYFVV